MNSSPLDFHVVSQTIQEEVKRLVSQVDSDQVDAVIAAISQAERIFVAGKGRTGFQMSAFAMRLAQMGIPTHCVGEVTTPKLGEGDLLLLGSSSGETASLVNYAETAHKEGAYIAVITANLSSKLAQEAQALLELPAINHKISRNEEGNFSSIQPMGSLFEGALGVVLNTMVIQLMDRLGIDELGMISRHANME